MRRLVLVLVLAFAPRAFAQPSEPTRPPPVQQWRGPSGFWTSPIPTEDRPYRWGKLTIGIGVMGLMGVLMWQLVKRTSRPTK